MFFQQVFAGKSAGSCLHGGERMDALATRLRRDEPAPPTRAGYIVMADAEGSD